MPGNARTERSCLEQILKYQSILINDFHLPVAAVFSSSKGLKVIGSRKLRDKLRSDILLAEDSYNDVVEQELTAMADTADGADYQTRQRIPIKGRSEYFRRLPFPLKNLDLQNARSILGELILNLRSE